MKRLFGPAGLGAIEAALWRYQPPRKAIFACILSEKLYRSTERLAIIRKISAARLT
jgi:hypothetical protein